MASKVMAIVFVVALLVSSHATKTLEKNSPSMDKKAMIPKASSQNFGHGTRDAKVTLWDWIVHYYPHMGNAAP
uniref:Transmembrane protein n=1 Tax=Lilium longiflorum TaxID=4690 RepID=F8UMB0_LILLO|nr:hypothetical protein [Lilium longiflorum]